MKGVGTFLAMKQLSIDWIVTGRSSMKRLLVILALACAVVAYAESARAVTVYGPGIAVTVPPYGPPPPPVYYGNPYYPPQYYGPPVYAPGYYPPPPYYGPRPYYGHGYHHGYGPGPYRHWR
jgi:hypothetical protein